ncbi:MAG: phage tail sheath subtilisin-like domain-containing protein [Gemmatimonadetes bacterium]|nr:phage tail sheath subtilisin-like domain-containing protein [Gemmatimonadota bacterium]
MTDFPRVFIEERPSGPPPIVAAPTGVTAFVGHARRGPTDRPVVVRSMPEFEQVFGGLLAESAMSYAVRHFFLEGGRIAVIARVRHGGAVDDAGDDDAGAPPTNVDLAHPSLEAAQRGLWLLTQADHFDLLCIPPVLGAEGDVQRSTWDAAAQFAVTRRALLLVDAPATWGAVADVTPAAVAQVITPGDACANAALYVPRIVAADPLQGNARRTCAACGAVAGVFARTDLQRGVWKAPAGLDARLMSALDVAWPIDDAAQAMLNPRGFNALRVLPRVGPAVWGARTLQGDDALGSVWKYVPVRRLALHIEESVVRGLQWVVFEPQGEPLWTAVRSVVHAFLDALWRQGAFAGTTPREAFLVQCDRSTMTQADIDAGRLRFLLGFAPQRAGEFVSLHVGLQVADGG